MRRIYGFKGFAFIAVATASGCYVKFIEDKILARLAKFLLDLQKALARQAVKIRRSIFVLDEALLNLATGVTI